MSQQVTLNETHRIMTICNACRYCEGFLVMLGYQNKTRAGRPDLIFI